MKFETSKFWKNRKVCCEFVEVLEVLEDTGETAELKVSWNEQMNRTWKTLVKTDQFRITKKEYGFWFSYKPRGLKESDEN